jgi:hypothetical protein
MFPVYRRNTATDDEAAIPQWQYTAYPVDNVGPFVQPARVEVSVDSSRLRIYVGLP